MLNGVLNTPLYDLCTFLLTVQNSFIAWKGGIKFADKNAKASFKVNFVFKFKDN